MSELVKRCPLSSRPPIACAYHGLWESMLVDCPDGGEAGCEGGETVYVDQ